MEPSIRKQVEPDMPAPQQGRIRKTIGAAFVVLVHILPIAVCLFAVVAVTRMAYSQWHYALWLSLLCGVGSLVLVMAFLSASGGTLFERGMTCLIILILALILLPIFSRVREAHRVHHTVVTGAH